MLKKNSDLTVMIKTLTTLTITLLAFGVTSLPSIEFVYKPKPILVKPTITHQSFVWVSMVEGVKHFEGFHFKPYRCPANVLTLGFGHTGYGVKKYNKIDHNKAHKLLLADLEHAKSLVEKYVKVPLTDGQKACLTSFTFNCGVKNLKQLVSGKGRLNEGNYGSIYKLLPQYCKANGKTLRGLEKRRSWELDLWQDDSNIFIVKN
jgi:lysozyme